MVDDNLMVILSPVLCINTNHLFLEKFTKEGTVSTTNNTEMNQKLWWSLMRPRGCWLEAVGGGVKMEVRTLSIVHVTTRRCVHFNVQNGLSTSVITTIHWTVVAIGYSWGRVRVFVNRYPNHKCLLG